MTALEDHIRHQQIIRMLIELREQLDALWAVATEQTQWSDNFITAQDKVQEQLENYRRKFH